MTKEIHLRLEQLATPGYAENRWQTVLGIFGEPNNPDPLLLSKFEQVEGAEPGTINYTDLDRMLQTATHIAAGLDLNGHGTGPIAIGVKHGNACGASSNESHVEVAIQQTLDGDRQAIFGGSVMVNFPVTESVADNLIHYGLEPGQKMRPIDVLAAPDIDEGVTESLKRKGGKLRIMINPALANLGVDSLDKSSRFRHLRGGEFLVQSNYTFVPNFREDERLAEPAVETDASVERSLIMAWAIGSTSVSNTITLVKDGMLIGNGVGQQDRVSAARLAVEKAERSGHDTSGAVAYSDSFFPFVDGPQVLVDAGIQAIFTSSGSVRDPEVFKTFKDGGVKVFALPDNEVRGFFGH